MASNKSWTPPRSSSASSELIGSSSADDVSDRTRPVDVIKTKPKMRRKRPFDILLRFGCFRYIKFEWKAYKIQWNKLLFGGSLRLHNEQCAALLAYMKRLTLMTPRVSLFSILKNRGTHVRLLEEKQLLGDTSGTYKSSKLLYSLIRKHNICQFGFRSASVTSTSLDMTDRVPKETCRNGPISMTFLMIKGWPHPSTK